MTRQEGLRAIRNVLELEAAALSQVSREIGFEAVEAAERIACCTGWVIVTGVGKAGWVGQKLVATLGTGNRAHFLHPSEAIHGDLGRVDCDDVVIAISNSGRSEDVLGIAPHLRQHTTGLSVCLPTVTLFDRHENRHDHLLDANIADFITTRFKSVPSGMPLIDAIQAMRERRISELPVIDTDGCPLGMLDITDVLSAVGLGM